MLAWRVRARRALIFSLLLSLSGCMMWRPAELARLSPEDGADRVRVTRTDSSSIVIEYASVRGDSIVGTGQDGTRAGVSLAEVESLESWEVDPGFLFVPAIGAFLLLLANFPLDDPPRSGVSTDGP